MRSKVCTLLLNSLINKRKHCELKCNSIFTDVWLMSNFIGISKRQIGNSWVRHKHLSESENANSYPNLLEFWNSQVIELDTSSYRNQKILIAMYIRNQTSDINFEVLLNRWQMCQKKVFYLLLLLPLLFWCPEPIS